MDEQLKPFEEPGEDDWNEPAMYYKLRKDCLWWIEGWSIELKAGELCCYFAHSDTYLFKSRKGITPYFPRELVESRPDWFEMVDEDEEDYA